MDTNFSSSTVHVECSLDFDESTLRKKYEELLGEYISKTWGSETFLYHNNKAFKAEPFVCETVKLLTIEKEKNLSIHFHKEKVERFIMIHGAIEVTLIEDGIMETFLFQKGDPPLIIKPCLVHSMKGINDINYLIEVSTLDRVKDSYRITKGTDIDQ